MLVTGRVLCDGDLDELDPNPLSFVGLINLQIESLAQLQSVDVASGLHKAVVLCSVARSPSLIQLESEHEPTGVERVLANFGEVGVLEIYIRQRFARFSFNCVARRLSRVGSSVGCLKADKGLTICQAVSYITVESSTTDPDVVRDGYFNCKRNAIG